MEKILLVQRNAKELSANQELLVQGQYEVLTACTTKEAIKLLEADPSIDLVISDLSLLDKNGLILLQYVKQTPRFHYTPIIMTCSSDERDNVNEAIKYKPDDIIVKPLTEEIIATKVKKAIKNGKRTVLIVDDDEIILNLLKHVIEIERFKVLTATNVDEALRLMEENVVHAVVTDIIMPGMNGMELLAAIKKKYKNIPVIIITGYSGDFTPEKAMGAGADGYFKKPFRNTELIKILKGVISDSHEKASNDNQPAPKISA